MKKTGLRRKILAGLAALAMLGTTVGLPVTEQAVYADAPELPTETNTTFEKARELEFGSSIAGTFSKNDGRRYYKFSLDKAGRLNLGVEHGNGDSIYIKLYDDSQTEIYNYVDWGSSSRSFSLDPIYLTGGFYYMCVECYSDTTFSFIANMDFMGESFTETQDVNNDMASNASTISLKKKYKGILAINDDIDYYRFQVPAAGQITFNITNSTNATVKYGFYDQSLNPAYANTVRSNQKVTQPVSVKRSVYYLAIAKEDVNKGTGSYTFSIDYVQKGSSGSTANNVTVGQATVKTVKNSAKKKMTVQWNRVSGASGYQLWYSTDPNFKKGVSKKSLGSSVTSKTYSGLKSRRTYYVKIRAYKNVNGTKKYGKWSNKKSIFIRK